MYIDPHSFLSSQGRRRRFVQFGLVYALAYIAIWYAASVLATLGVASLWFLPAGLRFFCLFALGAPGLLLEVAAGLLLMLVQFAVSGPTLDASPPVQLLDRLYELLVFPLSYAVVVLPLRRYLGGKLNFTEPGRVLLFVVAALVAAVLAAAAGTGRLYFWGLLPSDQLSAVFVSWMTGDFIGALTLAPCLLVLLWPRLLHFLQRGRWRAPQEASGELPLWRETLAVCALAAAALWFMGTLPRYFGSIGHSPLQALLLLIPLAAMALRHRLRGVVLAIVLLDASLVLIVALQQQHVLALEFQLVMVALALTGLWLGGAVESNHLLVQRLRDLAIVSNDFLWETDRAGVLHVSGGFSETLSVRPGQLWRNMLAPGAQPDLARMELAGSRQQAFNRLEVIVRGGQNAPRWVQVSGLPLWDFQGEFAGFRGTAVDISEAVKVRSLLQEYNQKLLDAVAERTRELHRSNTELAFKEQHMRVLLAAVPVGVLELDANGLCRYLNDNAAHMTGRSVEEGRGLTLADFVHVDDRERVQQVLQQPAQGDAVHSLEFCLDRTNIWCAATWIHTPLGQGAGATTAVVLVDSTLQHQQSVRMWALAHTDLLTGLPNRNLFQDRCSQALTLARRHDSGAALLWIDLDGFKSVNDTLGHAAGDALLQQVAQRLKSRMRDTDTVARIGGDEFAVIMTDINQVQAAQQIAQALVDSLHTTFELPQGNAQISACVGIALFPQQAQTLEELMRYADAAMYVAKRAGKNRVQTWSDDLPLTNPAALSA